MTKHIINDTKQYREDRQNERYTSFYIYYEPKINKISLLFAMLSFIFITMSYYFIYAKNKEQGTYLTNIYGQTTQYEQNERRKRIINEHLQVNKNEQ